MPPSLKPEHLKRYKDIAWFLVKYGRSDLLSQAGLDGTLDETEPRREVSEPVATPEAAALAADLEKLGPTFVKLGQLLSTRPDLLPAPYMEALTRLQDQVAPFPFSDVERIVSEELGVRLAKAFVSFDSEPIAAASLGQVHAARIPGGRQVAVKVQRPNIRQQVIEDLDALEQIAGFLDAHTEAGRRYRFADVLDEFRRSILRELDYRREAGNLTTLRQNLADFERIVIPAPIDDYTTSRVLTMEYVHGEKVTALGTLDRPEVDRTQLAEDLFRAYLKQVLVDGFFHADPHPGNVFLTDDGRIALIDLGMVARLTANRQELLLQLLLAISEGKSDEAVYLATRIGEKGERFDEQTFRRRVVAIVEQQQVGSVEQLEIGKIMLEVARVSNECDIRVPPELAMLGKTLLNLDQVATALDPNFDANAAIRRSGAEVVQQRLRRSVSPANLVSSLIDMTNFVEQLPRRMNSILDRVANNELSIHVDAIDERRLMEGLQKIANRITMGLVLAALIIGAAMLMNVPTTFQILGYPGLAIILFLLAAAGGVVLVGNILINDVRARRG